MLYRAIEVAAAKDATEFGRAVSVRSKYRLGERKDVVGGDGREEDGRIPRRNLTHG